MNKLLVATGNRGKYLEYVSLLSSLDIEVVSLEGASISEPEETGSSFEENAELKARYYYDKLGIPCIADDSGLCVEPLDNMPGIYSARWAGPEKDFKLAMRKIESGLREKGIDPESDHVPAYFYCAISFYAGGERAEMFSGRIDGSLKFPMRGEAGFGYDPIFWPANYSSCFAEMPAEQKGAISHRYIATNKFLDFLNKTVAK